MRSIAGCTSRQSIAALALTLGGCAVAVASDAAGVAAGGAGVEAAAVDYVVSRYGPWGAVLWLMWRALRPLEDGARAVSRLADRAESGPPIVIVGHRHVIEDGPTLVDED